jgi:drug/metabolite transporter (DMT)-like permease
MICSESAEARLPAVLILPRGRATARTGILWMLAATLLFVGQDSTSRILLASLPPAEIAFGRFFVHLVLVAGFLAWREPRLMLSRRPILQMVRSILLLCTTLFGLLALNIMPFLDFSAVAWVAPVLVTALSVLLLHEKVRLRGWISVFAGLAGVWIIAGQGGIALSPLMAWPLLAALCNALYQIATRKLHTSDAALTTLFYSPVAGAMVCAAWLPFAGVAPTRVDTMLLIFLGSLGAASHFCMIRAFAAAPANIIAPFGYVALLWALLSGMIVFGEVPSVRTLIGAGLIVAAGLSIFLSARPRRKKPAQAAPPA